MFCSLVNEFLDSRS